MEILRFLSIGLVVGFVSGAVGIGGGVLMVPALMWICGLAPAKAAGTTLAVLVIPVLLPSALEYYRRGNTDITAALFIALAFGFGGFAGAWMRNNEFLPEDILRLCFGLIMMYIAFNLIIMSDSEATKAAAGFTATFMAWLAYLGLRLMGKHALEKPKLREQIQRMDEQGRGDPDYYI